MDLLDPKVRAYSILVATIVFLVFGIVAFKGVQLYHSLIFIIPSVIAVVVASAYVYKSYSSKQ